MDKKQVASDFATEEECLSAAARDQEDHELIVKRLNGDAYYIKIQKDELYDFEVIFAVTLEKQINIIRGDSQVLPERPAVRDQAVAAVIADMLVYAALGAFPGEVSETGSSSVLQRGFSQSGDPITPATSSCHELRSGLKARDLSAALVIGSLHSLATAIRESSKPRPSLEPIATERCAGPAMEEVHVLVHPPFRYRDFLGKPVVISAGLHRVPLPVADEAIRRGLAVNVDGDDPDGPVAPREVAKRLHRLLGYSRYVHPEDAEDLDINFQEWLELEPFLPKRDCRTCRTPE